MRRSLIRGFGSRRGGILGGLLVTAAVIVVLTIAAGLFVVRNVRVETAHRHGGDDVAIDTPGGRFQIRAHEDLDPAAVGVPIYPGSRRVKDSGVATFEWVSADGKQEKGMSVAGASLFTTDSPSKVREYYRTQLPNWLTMTDRDGSTKFEFHKDGHKQIVAIREKDGGTSIGVASIGEPASN
jgi:hypothetical protein